MGKKSGRGKKFKVAPGFGRVASGEKNLEKKNFGRQLEIRKLPPKIHFFHTEFNFKSLPPPPKKKISFFSPLLSLST